MAISFLTSQLDDARERVGHPDFAPSSRCDYWQTRTQSVADANAGQHPSADCAKY
jgi:hypothetical protein